ncbi:MAG: cation transporter [Endomicrobiales bacterium]|nr:cation transporter [Endomicrobiales bacterium]
MNKEKKLIIIILFNISLMLLEVIGGVISRSLALVSDAAHMLTDSLAIFLSYIALRLSKKPATEEKTFGYHRTEILAAFINGLALILISGFILYKAVQRFFYPVSVKVDILLVIAFFGLLGNVFGALLLRKDSHENLNIRGALLHLIGDALSSAGVILGGVIIYLTKVNLVDSIIGILISAVVFRSAFKLLKESGEILLESVPKDIRLNDLQNDVENIPGVKEFHDVHIWTITSGRRALSGHILIDNISTAESQNIICKVKELLNKKYSINHTTIEVECKGCKDNICEFK